MKQLVDRGVYILALTAYQYQVLALPTPAGGVTHLLKPVYPHQELPVAVIRGGLINGVDNMSADDMLDFTGWVMADS